MKKSLFFMALCLSGYASASSTILLTSEAGDYIGGGKDVNLTGEFTYTIDKDVINISHPSGFWFEFAAPNHRDLNKGGYLNAERAAFRGPFNPGISVNSSGRGCNRINGEFYIYEIDTTPNNESLALDFIQHCDGSSGKLSGSVRLNTEVATPYPYPFPIIESPSRTLIEGTSWNVGGTKSFSNIGTIESYFWEQISGPTLNILDPTQPNARVELSDEIALGGEEVRLQLTVTDNLGQSESVERSISIKSKSDPQTYFEFTSQDGDYIGQGKSWFYDQSSSLIQASKNYSNGVNVSIRGSENWDVNFAAPNNEPLEVKAYDVAQRFPFNPESVAGLSVSGNGRGCNKLYGSFDVSRLLIEGDQVKEFKASFKQLCEQPTGPGLFGEVAVNARHESVPVANAGVDIDVNERQIINLNGSASFDNLGSIRSYQWSSDNFDIKIVNSSKSRAYIEPITLSDKTESRTFNVNLLVTDDEGYKAVDTVKITVRASNLAPIAADDRYSVVSSEQVTLTPLTNDSDSDGVIQENTIRIITQPLYGTVVVDEHGQIIYTHNGANIVEDTIVYTVNDNDGIESNPATITIEVKEKDTGKPPFNSFIEFLLWLLGLLGYTSI